MQNRHTANRGDGVTHESPRMASLVNACRQNHRGRVATAMPKNLETCPFRRTHSVRACSTRKPRPRPISRHRDPVNDFGIWQATGEARPGVVNRVCQRVK